MSNTNLLFLLKQTDGYGSYSSITSKSGLLNSAKITAHQITKHLGVPTHVKICVDGNEVDKFVSKIKPTLVLIEALWVTPTKIKELVKLHPKVKFVILIHSNIPFLANEGIAIGYIKRYIEINNVNVAFNSFSAYTDFFSVGIKCTFLPNIYEDVAVSSSRDIGYVGGTTLNIASFGAIRPMKNQLIQAFAAIVVAESIGVKVRFHINGTRPEQGGESVLKNMRSLFENDSTHKLVEHDWTDRDKFLETIRRMDIGLQLSFSETFNIVSADFVKENVPIIVSDQIEWMPWQEQASMYNIDDMVTKMLDALKHRSKVVKRNVKALNAFNIKSLSTWNRYLKNL